MGTRMPPTRRKRESRRTRVCSGPPTWGFSLVSLTVLCPLYFWTGPRLLTSAAQRSDQGNPAFRRHVDHRPIGHLGELLDVEEGQVLRG